MVLAERTTVSDSGPLVPIVGRTNVGKSTLFNELTGQAGAITSPVPGTTRDWLEGTCLCGEHAMRLADTGGWGSRYELGGLIDAQLEQLLRVSTLAILVVSARETIQDDEFRLARTLKRQGISTLLVCNKCDRPEDDTAAWEYTRLGFGVPLPVSALHHRNLQELRRRLAGQRSVAQEHADSTASPERTEARCILLGQTNVGKSSVFNAWLKQPRSLVHARPGTTRDPVHAKLKLNGQLWDLVDTAGVKHQWRRTTGPDTVDREAQGRSLQLLEHADVVVLLLDVTSQLARQDLRLAQAATKEGAALVVALNKCDLLPPRRLDPLCVEAARFLQVRFPQVGRVPLLLCSAVSGMGVPALSATVSELVKLRRVRFPASALSELAYTWPTTGKPWRIRQTGVAPLSFFAAPPVGVKLGSRFVINRIREAFGLHGVPILIRWSPPRRE